MTDLKIACKPFSNFMELIKTNAKLEEEFQIFEKTFWKWWNFEYIFEFRKKIVAFYSFFFLIIYIFNSFYTLPQYNSEGVLPIWLNSITMQVQLGAKIMG